MDKGKFKKIIFGLIAIIIVVILVVVLLALVANRSVSKANAENTMLSAAKKYYSEKSEELPLEVNDKVVLSAETLISEGYMKDISEKVKNCEAFNGSVEVINLGNEKYHYTSFVKCSDEDVSTNLESLLISKVNILSGSDEGLYFENGEYIFKGEKPDNYLKFDEKGITYRIVKVTADGEVGLIPDDTIKTRGPWDDRYNNDIGSNEGINVYRLSRIKDTLETIYGSEIISQKAKDVMMLHEFCVANRSTDDTSKDGSTECAEKTIPSYLGLIPVYDFMNASVDASCANSLSHECSNYNYLADFSWPFWLANGDSSTSNKCYGISDGLTSKKCFQSITVRPYMFITGAVKVESGTGTASDPYIVK